MNVKAGSKMFYLPGREPQAWPLHNLVFHRKFGEVGTVLCLVTPAMSGLSLPC